MKTSQLTRWLGAVAKCAGQKAVTGTGRGQEVAAEIAAEMAASWKESGSPAVQLASWPKMEKCCRIRNEPNDWSLASIYKLIAFACGFDKFHLRQKLKDKSLLGLRFAPTIFISSSWRRALLHLVRNVYENVWYMFRLRKQNASAAIKFHYSRLT